MGKSDKNKQRLTKSNPKFEEEERELNPPIILESTDDEACDDLSLKIVEKAMSRASNNTSSNPSSSSIEPEVIVTDLKKKVKKTKKRNAEKMEAQVNAADEVAGKKEGVKSKESNGLLERDLVEKSKESNELLEKDPEEKSDNVVLRKLLRGPRYFDPPDNSWGNCYNCGEGGHMAANCTAARRKKPCFVCGSLEHNAKECKQGRDCFICKKGGHRAKDCPEKSTAGFQKAKLCLKCGDSGHDLFSCKSSYCPDDLKEVQCYICKCFGHLCCVNYATGGGREASCYRCGQLGHTGLECARIRAETASTGTPNSCFKCGEEGHMARYCTSSSSKKGKRKGEFPSPSSKRSYSKDKGNHIGAKTAPHDLGKGRKRNKTQYSQHATSSQPKQHSRGGWMTEDPVDYYHGNNYNSNGWGHPTTPVAYRSNDRFHGNYGGTPGRKLHYESPASNGYQNRFSASRFGNSSSHGRRGYGWDY